MLRLLLAGPGQGKTHWLRGLGDECGPLLDLTLTPHRAFLLALVDAVGETPPKRATIAELVALLRAKPGRARLDNIDHAGRKALYSIMALSAAGWEFWATATERKRVAPILERQAALLVEHTPPDLATVVRAVWPEATAADIARIRTVARTPAAAANLARVAAAGEPLNAPPPARNLYPLLTIAFIVGAALWLNEHRADLSAAAVSAITLVLYWLRRRFYLRG